MDINRDRLTFIFAVLLCVCTLNWVSLADRDVVLGTRKDRGSNARDVAGVNSDQQGNQGKCQGADCTGYTEIRDSPSSKIQNNSYDIKTGRRRHKRVPSSQSHLLHKNQRHHPKVGDGSHIQNERITSHSPKKMSLADLISRLQRINKVTAKDNVISHSKSSNPDDTSSKIIGNQRKDRIPPEDDKYIEARHRVKIIRSHHLQEKMSQTSMRSRKPARVTDSPTTESTTKSRSRRKGSRANKKKGRKHKRTRNNHGNADRRRSHSRKSTTALPKTKTTHTRTKGKPKGNRQRIEIIKSNTTTDSDASDVPEILADAGFLEKEKLILLKGDGRHSKKNTKENHRNGTRKLNKKISEITTPIRKPAGGKISILDFMQRLQLINKDVGARESLEENMDKDVNIDSEIGNRDNLRQSSEFINSKYATSTHKQLPTTYSTIERDNQKKYRTQLSEQTTIATRFAFIPSNKAEATFRISTPSSTPTTQQSTRKHSNEQSSGLISFKDFLARLTMINNEETDLGESQLNVSTNNRNEQTDIRNIETDIVFDEELHFDIEGPEPTSSATNIVTENVKEAVPSEKTRMVMEDHVKAKSETEEKYRMTESHNEKVDKKLIRLDEQQAADKAVHFLEDDEDMPLSSHIKIRTNKGSLSSHINIRTNKGGAKHSGSEAIPTPTTENKDHRKQELIEIHQGKSESFGNLSGTIAQTSKPRVESKETRANKGKTRRRHNRRKGKKVSGLHSARENHNDDDKQRDRSHDGRIRADDKRRNRQRNRNRHGSRQILRPRHRGDTRPEDNWGGHPEGVERLESKLHPSIRVPARKLMGHIKNVLQFFQTRVMKMHHVYNNIFSKTRFSLMLDVRSEMEKVILSNEEVYDSVIDAAMLTKYVYIRAHENGLNISAPRTVFPNLPKVPRRNFNQQYRKMNREQRNALHFLDRAKRKHSQSKGHELHVNAVMSSITGHDRDLELDELRRISNRTISMLEAHVFHNNGKMKMERYKDGKNGSHYTLMDASYLNRRAYMSLREARDIFMKSQQRVREFRRERKRPTSTGSVDESITAEEKQQLLPVISKTETHAMALEDVIGEMNRTLIPVMEFLRNMKVDSNSGLSTLRLTQARRSSSAALKAAMQLQSLMARIMNVVRGEDGVRQRCEDFLEGSGVDEETALECDQFLEGSGEMELENDDEDDFEFEDIGSNNHWKKNRFSVKLGVYIASVLAKSKELHDSAEQLKASLKELLHLYNKVDRSVKTVKNAKLEVSNFLQSWDEDKRYIDDITNRIQLAKELVENKANEAKTKSKAAIETALRKLEAVKQEKSKKKNRRSLRRRKKVDRQEDMAMFAEVGDAVGKAKASINSIVTLQKVLSDPCKKVRDQKESLSSKIAELKKQIEKGRLMLSGLQIPAVSLPGSETLQATMAMEDNSATWSTSIEFCIKPKSLDDPLVVLHGNSSVGYGVLLDEGYPTVKVYNLDGDTLESDYIRTLVVSDTWYKLRMQRYGNKVTLKMSPMVNEDNLLETDEETITVDDIDPAQTTPTTLLIGGYPKSFKNDAKHDGCIADLKVNGHNVNSFYAKNKIKPCANNCPGNVVNTSIIFSGNGFVHFDKANLPSVELVYLEFGFRSRQMSGLLMILCDHSRRLHVEVYLENGKLRINANTGQAAKQLQSSSILSDGIQHYIKVTLAQEIKMNIDGVNTYTELPGRPPDGVRHALDGLLIGGMVTNHKQVSDSKYRHYIGCIQGVKVNSASVPFSLFTDATGVYVGSCNDDFYAKCVHFDEGSKPVSLAQRDEVSVIHLSVDKNALGTAILFKKSDKFSIVVNLEEKGFSTFNFIDGEQESIAYSNTIQGQRRSIVLKDLGSVAEVHVDNKKSSIGYDEGWWWDEYKYDIVIGGVNEEFEDHDRVTQFQGEIAELIVDDRFINIAVNATSHSLVGCHANPRETTTKTEVEAC